MRIATWNVNSLAVRVPRVLEWLAMAQPDVLCLQETKLSDGQFPREQLAALGYEAATHGTGQWNGVAILSRVGLADVRRGFAGEPGTPEVEARALSATCGGLRVWSVYVPNGRTVDSPHFAYKLAWLSAIREALAEEAQSTTPLVVCGDFNVAPADTDVWDPGAFVGSTHVTAAERSAVTALLDLELVDILPRALKGLPFTYWDYRAGNFHKGFGMRIDLVLISRAIAASVTDAYIDRDTRKGKLPSDHAAVVVDIDIGARAENVAQAAFAYD
jgi:exodeoxyribonuclease III